MRFLLRFRAFAFLALATFFTWVYLSTRPWAEFRLGLALFLGALIVSFLVAGLAALRDIRDNDERGYEPPGTLPIGCIIAAFVLLVAGFAALIVIGLK